MKLNNKKGLAFNVLIAVFGIIALTIIVVNFYGQDLSGLDWDISTKLLRFSSDSERLKLYLDDAVKIEANNLTFELAKTGAILSDGFVYRNKSLWTQKNKEWFTLDKFKSFFNESLNKNLKKRYEEYPFEFFDVNYDFNTDKEILTGIPLTPIAINRTLIFNINADKVKVPAIFTNISDLEVPANLFQDFLKLNFCDSPEFSVSASPYFHFNPDDFKFYIVGYDENQNSLILSLKGGHNLTNFITPFIKHNDRYTMFNSDFGQICNLKSELKYQENGDFELRSYGSLEVSSVGQNTTIFIEPIVNVDLGLAYFDIYKNLTEAVDELKTKCSSSEDIENCVNNFKSNAFEKRNFEIVDLETQDEKAFYDFVDDFMMCEQSNDRSCSCEFKKENTAENLVVDILDRNEKPFPSWFDDFNGDYTKAFFAFNGTEPFSFALNLNYTGIMEIKACGINPLEDNLYLDKYSKRFSGIEIPLNYRDDIKAFEENGEKESSNENGGALSLLNGLKEVAPNDELRLNYSLIKTHDGKVCFLKPDVDDDVINFFYVMYAYFILFDNANFFKNINLDADNNFRSSPIDSLNKFYSDHYKNYNDIPLDFCEFLKNNNFENWEELFSECITFVEDNNNLNPSLGKHFTFNNFKEDLLKLKKKPCNVQKHYYRFDLRYNQLVFNYRTFKFEKPIFSFSVYI